MEVPFYFSKLLFELNEQRKRDFFCDCSILVEGRVFKAHRNVLFAGSGYFRALLVHYLQVRTLSLVLGEAGDIGHHLRNDLMIYVLEACEKLYVFMRYVYLDVRTYLFIYFFNIFFNIVQEYVFI